MTKDELLSAAVAAIRDAREQNPLSPSITNSVTINFVANAQLAAGGSAAMVYLPDEGEGLAKAARSFYINLGTLYPVYEESIPRCCRALFQSGCPWVLDPVAIGIGSLRTRLLAALKEFKPSVIRANASETIALAALWNLADEKSSGVRGVDSTDEVLSARNAAAALARWTGGAVAVSGRDDLVTDGETAVLCHGGSKFLPMVTGAGCSLGGVVSVFAAVASPLAAALAGTVAYNEAAVRAEKKSAGPGTFQAAFLDELYLLEESAVLNSSVELLKP